MSSEARKSMPGAGFEPALLLRKGVLSDPRPPSRHDQPASETNSPPRAQQFAQHRTRRCPRCQESKPLDEFGTRLRRGKRDPLPYCKRCHQDYWREWYYTKGGSKKFGEAVERYHAKYPERHAARQIAQEALRVGKIVSLPCAARAKGGCKGDLQMHHPDYSKPLDIVWLCRTHHIEADQALGIGKRGRPRKAVA